MANRGKVFAQEARAVLDSFSQPIPHAVNFYRQQELPFGIFSNFFPAPIIVNKITWSTSEHYFQAYKFEPTCQTSFNDVINCNTPGDAAAVGRDRNRPLRADWEKVKDDIMFDALTAKFLQYDDLLHILMKTKGSKLVEHTKNDSYWGDGGNGTGKNMLGLLLMKLRDVLETIDLKSERAKINEIMRETGVNPLRLGSTTGAPASSSATAATSSTTTNDNTTATASSAQDQQQVKKKNRLQ